MLVVLVVVTLHFAAVPAARAGQATPVPGAGALRVVEERSVAIPNGVPLALSPDGHWLAVSRPGADGLEICAFDAATLAEQRCAALETKRIVTWAVAWSPDSTRLAFTEDAVETQRESDVWVFEAESGALVDLTDDGVGGRLRDDEAIQAHPPVDLYPAWSPDGSELVFVRVEGLLAANAMTGIYRVPTDGGEPTAVATVKEEGFAVLGGPRWMPDGQTILYTLHESADDPVGGLWSVDVAGGAPRPIGDWNQPDLLAPILVAVSARGEALVSLSNSPSQYQLPDFTYAVVDVDTGAIQPLMLGEVGADDYLVISAAFSPDGRQLLVQYGISLALAVRDGAAGAEYLVGQVEAPLGNDLIAAVTWAANGLVFCPHAGPDGGAVLLRLAAA
jgi:Tol biopolymer transport system component